MAAAVMITGTTIGAITRPAIRPAPGNRLRASPTAAAVPAAVAISALGIMTITLVDKVSIQAGEAEQLAVPLQREARAAGRSRSAPS